MTRLKRARVHRFLVDEHPAEPGAAVEILAVTCHQEVVGRLAVVFLGLQIHHRDVVAVDFPGEAPSAADVDRLARVRQTDAAAEKQIHQPLEALRAHAELPGVLEEEVALFWKEQLEPREVHLLLVDFGLREIGVDRQIERKPVPETVLHVGADVLQRVGR